MSTGLNQYAVYRLRLDLKQTRTLRHQSYQYLLKNNLKVVSDYYRQVFLARFDPKLTLTELRRQLEKELPAGLTGTTLGVSDVLAITRDGISTAYYVDTKDLIPLEGFYHVTSSGTVLTINTRDYEIEGRPGTWSARDEIWIDGQHFLLMQSQQYGVNAAFAVLDSHGQQAAEDTFEGFSPAVVRLIREYIHSQEENNNSSVQNTTDNKEGPSANGKNTQEDSEHKELISPAENSKISKQILGNTYAGKTTRKKNQKRIRRRKKGVIPLRLRQSLLKRLREYQRRLQSFPHISRSQPQ